MPQFSIPLSGLTASSTALSAIANNLANLNTVGYKATRTLFRDLFYQYAGSSGLGDPIQIGAGTAVSSIGTLFNGGNIDTTGLPTDAAIMGDGFFVLQQDGGGYAYTRAGNFQVNDKGFLASEDGQVVMGYPAVAGVPGATLGPLQLGKGQVSPPSATTSLNMRTNLDAAAAVGAQYETTLTVYDSIGATHLLRFQFTKTGQNQWDYQATLPAADTGGTGDPTVVKTGTLSFDESGQLNLPAADITGIDVTGLASGAGDLSITWNLRQGGSGLLTQMASPSNTASTGQNGWASGTLQSFAIGPDGVIQGSFSNEKTMVLGQVALANFPNAQGLMREGQNNFSSTLASGAAVIGAPGTGGRGSLAGGALELSNVDIATEFARMIMAQRGFQANARAITTFDEITQDTINMKR
jgi:flagellar hook protein FlgE